MVLKQGVKTNKSFQKRELFGSLTEILSLLDIFIDQMGAKILIVGWKSNFEKYRNKL